MQVVGNQTMTQTQQWTWSTSDVSGNEGFECFHQVNNQVQCLWDLSNSAAEKPFQASIELAQIGECTLSHARTDPLIGHRTKAHIGKDGQDFFSLMYMAEGSMIFTQRDNESCARQHDIALWDSAQPAQTRFDHPIRQLHVMIPRTTAIAQLPGIERLCGLSINGESEVGKILRSHIVQLGCSIAGIPERLRPLIMDATLQLIAATFHPEEERITAAVRRPALLRIEKYILGNLGDPDLSVASIADALGYSARHVHRLFDGFDFSVGDWIKRRRLLAARTLLASNPSRDLSVAQVAYRFGFRQHSHFSRAFKEEFGVSPKQFRQGLANDSKQTN